MGNYSAAPPDRDRAFDINSLNELLLAGRAILTEAVRISEEMEKSITAVSGIYDTIDPQYRTGALGADIHALTGKIKDEIYQETMERMETILTKLINEIPACDSAAAKEMDAAEQTLTDIQGRIRELQNFFHAGSTNLGYQEFKSRLEDMKSGWDETTEDWSGLLVEIENDLMGTAGAGILYSHDPVNLSTGNFVYDHEDLRIAGEIPLSFHRYYNAKDRYKGSLGRSFVHNYDIRLETDEEKSRAAITLSDGQKKTFRRQPDGAYLPSHSALEALTEEPDGFLLTFLSGSRIRFSRDGKMVRMENRSGRGTAFFYDRNGRLEKAETDTGSALSYSYNEAGQLIRVSDHAARSVVLSYERGKLSSVTDPEGNTRAYRYGKNGRIEETVNPSGITAVKNTYDEKRRILRQDFPDGGHMDYAYDDRNRKVILTERNGAVTSYVHDGRYRCTDILYQDGTAEHFTYNKKNQCTRHTDRNGNTTRMAYDGLGNLAQKINPLGEKTNMTYNGEGKLAVLSVNGKEKLRCLYDKKGNLVSLTGADGNGTRTDYDAQGRPVRMEHPDKTATALTYDERGNITAVCGPDGAVTAYRYDSLNRVIESIDGRGFSTSYEYDSMGRVIKTTNPLGASRTYRYNKSGKVTGATDYDGFSVEAAYNEIGKISSLTDKEGNTTRFLYDKMWNTAKILQPDGSAFSFRYDADSRLIRKELPGGGSEEYTYDGNGNCTGKTDAEGGHTAYAYDALNRVVETTDENGSTFRYAYDGEGNLTSVTDPEGNRTLYTYDEGKHCTRKTDALGNTTAYAYDVMGNLEAVLYPDGTKETCRYQNGRPAEVTLRDGRTLRYAYDGNGSCTAVETDTGERTAITYDALNRRETVTGPDGGTARYEYDAVGNVTKMTDPDGNAACYAYTPGGNLSSVTDALGGKTVYTYDVMGRLTAVERTGSLTEGEKAGEASAQRTLYEWNESGLINAVTDPLGEKESYAYDKNGRMTDKWDRDGCHTAYAYDAAGLLTHILYADGETVTYSYDALRRLRQVKDSAGTTDILTDVLGRASRVTDPRGNSTGYEWGSMGERRRLLYPDGREAVWHYNEKGQPAALDTDGGRITYAYDERGRLKEKTFPDGTATCYSYTPSGRPETIRHKGKNLEEEYSYRYDLTGNKTEARKTRTGMEEDSGIFRYAYDALHRLTGVEKDGKLLRAYAYDAFGNRTRKEDYSGQEVEETLYRYNEAGQLAALVSGGEEQSCTYDRRGNLNTVRKNGELVKTFAYDAAGRLRLAVERKTGRENRTGSLTEYAARYTYDAFGNRTGQTLYSREAADPRQESTWEDFGSKDPERQIRYIPDVTRPYRSLLRMEEGRNSRTFYWDGNAALMEMEEEGAESGFYSYLQDDLGSPMHLLSEDGKIRESYGYDEFGMELFPEENRGGRIQPFGYTGYQMEEAGGVYYAQARRYDAGIGRFISEDKIKGFTSMPCTLNQYSYCWNRPLDYVDLDGLWPSWNDIKTTVGNAISDVGNTIKNGVEKAVDSAKNFYEEHKEAILNGLKITGALVVAGLLIAGTVFSGGALGAICAGALSGGMIGMTVDAGMQIKINGIENFSLDQMLISGVAGAASGALGFATANTAVLLLGNAAINDAAYYATQKARGEEVTVPGMLFSGILGGAAGFIGGSSLEVTERAGRIMGHSYLSVMRSEGGRETIDYITSTVISQAGRNFVMESGRYAATSAAISIAENAAATIKNMVSPKESEPCSD